MRLSSFSLCCKEGYYYEFFIALQVDETTSAATASTSAITAVGTTTSATVRTVTGATVSTATVSTTVVGSVSATGPTVDGATGTTVDTPGVGHATTAADYDATLVVWASVGLTLTLGSVLLLVVVGLACLWRRVRRRTPDPECGYYPMRPLSTPHSPSLFSVDDSEEEIFDASEARRRRVEEEAEDIERIERRAEANREAEAEALRGREADREAEAIRRRGEEEARRAEKERALQERLAWKKHVEALRSVERQRALEEKFEERKRQDEARAARETVAAEEEVVAGVGDRALALVRRDDEGAPEVEVAGAVEGAEAAEVAEGAEAAAFVGRRQDDGEPEEGRGRRRRRSTKKLTYDEHFRQDETE